MQHMTLGDREYLWNLGLTSIRSLEVENGILASGREELYGCIFGRDSLITALSLLRLHEATGDEYFLALSGKILEGVASLQGIADNIESGEEPGKIIHEFRPDNHKHLTIDAKRPWFTYADGAMRNYDSIDSTLLFLLAAHAYLRAVDARAEKLLPHVKAALEWVVARGDSDGDFLLDYRIPNERTYGFLAVQSWMDSHDSVFHESGEAACYPIAPVEAQGYAWASLLRWADYFRNSDEAYAWALRRKASQLKQACNARFVLQDENGPLVAFAIDGNGQPMKDARSSAGHLLWAAYRDTSGGIDCILDRNLIPPLARRLMREDLFAPEAGMRTLSTRSTRFDAQSYHNGSIWPHDTEIVAEGLEHFGYLNEALRVRAALLKAYRRFGTPLEFYCFDGNSFGDRLQSGQQACQVQAWSAAALLCALQATAASIHPEEISEVVTQ